MQWNKETSLFSFKQPFPLLNGEKSTPNSWGSGGTEVRGDESVTGRLPVQLSEPTCPTD